jgi:hypothetical protein
MLFVRTVRTACTLFRERVLLYRRSRRSLLFLTHFNLRKPASTNDLRNRGPGSFSWERHLKIESPRHGSPWNHDGYHGREYHKHRLSRPYQGIPADLTTVLWVTVPFVLVSTSSMLIIGKIADLMGRKRIYALGMGIFTLGLVVCSLAQAIGQLIFFRALQAVGAAMTVSTSTAIVTEVFPRKQVGRGIGFLGMSVSVGFII